MSKGFPTTGRFSRSGIRLFCRTLASAGEVPIERPKKARESRPSAVTAPESLGTPVTVTGPSITSMCWGAPAPAVVTTPAPSGLTAAVTAVSMKSPRMQLDPSKFVKL